MSNSIRRLLELMSIPENRVLIIMDTTGSILPPSFENSLFDIALAQKKFDPEGKRLVAITDQFLQNSSSVRAAIPIPPCALEINEVPGGARLFGHGGYDSPFEGIENQEVYKDLDPTHLIFVSDMMMSPLKPESIPQAQRANTLFFVLPDIGEKALLDASKLFSPLGEVIPVATAQDRIVALAQLEAEKLEEVTPMPRSINRPPRI